MSKIVIFLMKIDNLTNNLEHPVNIKEIWNKRKLRDSKINLAYQNIKSIRNLNSYRNHLMRFMSNHILK